MKNIKNIFYNVNFSTQIQLSKNNKKLIANINNNLKNLSCLKILKNKDLIEYTIREVKKFSKNKKDFIVFGTGGSNLGARALLNILQGNVKVNIQFYDNIDPINFENSIKKLNLKKIGVIVISKSGKTSETLSQFLSIIELYNQQNILNILYKNSLVITEDKLSPLSKIAHNNKIMTLNHEKDVGGRYSVFTNVGMIPAIIGGLNVKNIHLGALKEFSKFNNNECKKIGQFFRYQRINKLIHNSVIMTYSDALFYFGKWYLQLWAESLGKNTKAINVMHAIGTTDQHSQLQLYMDGPKDKFFTFFTTNHEKKGLKLNNMVNHNIGIDYLNKKKMGDLMHAEQRAIIELFKNKKISIREIFLPKIDEYTIGQLMCFSIMETVSTCLYFGVNPFDQPAVEEGKILTKKFLS